MKSFTHTKSVYPSSMMFNLLYLYSVAVVGFTEIILPVMEGNEMNTSVCINHREPLQTSLSLTVNMLPAISQLIGRLVLRIRLR